MEQLGAGGCRVYVECLWLCSMAPMRCQSRLWFKKQDKKPRFKRKPRLRANAFSDACTRIRARAERAHAILVVSTGPWLPTSWIQSWHRFIVRCISRLRANAFSRRVYTHPSPRRARTCHPGNEHRTVVNRTPRPLGLTRLVGREPGSEAPDPASWIQSWYRFIVRCISRCEPTRSRDCGRSFASARAWKPSAQRAEWAPPAPDFTQRRIVMQYLRSEER